MSNAPRYRLVGYDIGTAPDENGGWVHWTDHEAEIARLTADLAESRAYAMALEQELRDRARWVGAVEMSEAAAFSAGYETADEASQAALAKAAIAALHDIDDLVANSEGVSGLHLNGDMAPWSEIMDGGAYGAWLQSVERLREAILALLPPADLAAKIGGE